MSHVVWWCRAVSGGLDVAMRVPPLFLIDSLCNGTLTVPWKGDDRLRLLGIGVPLLSPLSPVAFLSEYMTLTRGVAQGCVKFFLFCLGGAIFELNISGGAKMCTIFISVAIVQNTNILQIFWKGLWSPWPPPPLPDWASY